MVASSRSCAVWRSSTVRKPEFTKARAVPSTNPLRSQALDASQYSSNDVALRLMMSDNPISPKHRRAKPLDRLTEQLSLVENVGGLICLTEIGACPTLGRVGKGIHEAAPQIAER